MFQTTNQLGTKCIDQVAYIHYIYIRHHLTHLERNTGQSVAGWNRIFRQVHMRILSSSESEELQQNFFRKESLSPTLNASPETLVLCLIYFRIPSLGCEAINHASH